MQFTLRVKVHSAVWTTALTILLSGQQLMAVSAQYRILFLLPCGRKSMILHLIMAGKTGVIFPAPGTFERYHITFLVIMSTPTLFIEADTMYFYLCIHIFFSCH